LPVLHDLFVENPLTNSCHSEVVIMAASGAGCFAFGLIVASGELACARGCPGHADSLDRKGFHACGYGLPVAVLRFECSLDYFLTTFMDRPSPRYSTRHANRHEPVALWTQNRKDTVLTSAVRSTPSIASDNAGHSPGRWMTRNGGKCFPLLAFDFYFVDHIFSPSCRGATVAETIAACAFSALECPPEHQNFAGALGDISFR
jgi:hypothetical protein